MMGGGGSPEEGGQGRGLAASTPPKFKDLPAASDSTLAELLHRNFATPGTVTFHLVTKPSHPDQRTGRIHACHHAYHCSRQVRPLRGARSEVSSQTLRRLVPLQSTRHEAYIKRPGRFTKEEFEDLCFDFGIELDEDTEEDERPEGVPPELKIGQS